MEIVFVHQKCMSTISIYKSAKDNSSQETISIADLLSGIKYGQWKHLVEPVRAEKDKSKRSALKERLPAVTVSGAFSKRGEANLIAHSGFICVDIDNYTDKSRIKSDPYTYACFDSVSGLGFAVLVKCRPDQHKPSFLFLQKYYFETYGIVIDTAPQNVASLRYVSWDPTLDINERSKVSRTYTPPKKKPTSLPIVLQNDQVNEYIQQALLKGADLAPTYESYLALSFSIANGFGEAGRSYFHSLCAVNEKYDSRHADRQFDIALKRNQSGYTVGTFYYMLKQAGVSIKQSSTRELSIVAMGKKSGRDPQAITRQLTEINGIPEHQAASLVQEVFKRDDITLNTVSKDPERLIDSLVEWMHQNHSLKRNEITGAIEENGITIKSDRLNSIYLRARSAFNMGDVTFDLINRIIYSDFIPTYNPITEYIEKNSWRKSSGNIAAMLTTIDSDTPGGGVFLRKWLLGIIAVYHGQPVRYRLALVGKGRTGKTQWFRRLLPDALKPYYGESSLEAGKDDELLMCQKLILMDDELGGKNKVDEKRVKNLTSKQTFSLRAPYARQNEDFKRLAILCGTSNETDIIGDRTGNTRMLVIHVNSINHAAYNEIDKDELFMELYRTYQELGEECWYLNDEENNVLAKSSQDHTEINPEAELLQKYFLPDTEPGIVTEMTATEIKIYIENQSHQQIKSMKYFGIELRKYFGEQSRTEQRRTYRVIIRPQ